MTSAIVVSRRSGRRGRVAVAVWGHGVGSGPRRVRVDHPGTADQRILVEGDPARARRPEARTSAGGRWSTTQRHPTQQQHSSGGRKGGCDTSADTTQQPAQLPRRQQADCTHTSLLRITSKQSLLMLRGSFPAHTITQPPHHSISLVLYKLHT